MARADLNFRMIKSAFAYTVQMVLLVQIEMHNTGPSKYKCGEFIHV